MKIAVMQPYFFPYIGYFQLINAVDKFVFYDDVNFINRGWINRNRILINNKPAYFTVSLKDASQNKLINEIQILDNREKILKTIYLAYKKSPYFDDAWPIIESVCTYDTKNISELAIYSIKRVLQYLEVEKCFEVSSHFYKENKGLPKADRLIDICRINNAREYLNAINGKELYSKDYFANYGIRIYFLQSIPFNYKQFDEKFTPSLSIIDVLMFNSKEKVRELITLINII